MILSIIIPVYNAENYIERCLESLLDQNLDPGNYEIIAINDGSKDASLEKISQYEKEYDHIRVIDQKNVGLGATRNVGIRHAKGDYIYFIDADDYLASGFLNRVIKTCVENNLDIITFNTRVVDNENTYKDSGTENHVKDINILDGPTYIGALSYKNEAWWYITNRKFLLDLNLEFIEGKWMEDSLFTTTAFLAAHRIAHLPLDIHRYVRVETSILRSKDPEHYIKVIYDTEYVIKEWSQLIANYQNQPSLNKDCLEILKTRRDSFVFFVIIRVLKSTLSFKELWGMLMRIKEYGGYPIKHFIGREYNKPVYKVLTPLFNNKYTLKLLHTSFAVLDK